MFVDEFLLIQYVHTVPKKFSLHHPATEKAFDSFRFEQSGLADMKFSYS